jgi:phage gpG-like protein
MGIKGIAELQDLRKKLQAAAGNGPDGLKRKMLAAAAQAALTQIQLGFRTSTAPDGSPWAPLKVRSGMPLRDTGRLANSFSARATESGIEVGTNVEDKIVVTHQEGRTIVPVTAKRLRFKVPGAIGARGRRGPSSFAFAKKVTIPARPMVPSDGELPPKWRDACDAAADQAVRNYFKKTR